LVFLTTLFYRGGDEWLYGHQKWTEHLEFTRQGMFWCFEALIVPDRVQLQ